MKTLRHLLLFAFATSFSTAFAYTGQPKEVKCEIHGGIEITLNLNDIPASDIHLDAEHWKNICYAFSPKRIPIANGPYTEFAFSYLGCKKVNGKYVVQPNFFDGAFFRKTANDGEEVVSITSDEGSRDAIMGREISRKDGTVVEQLKTVNCTITALH